MFYDFLGYAALAKIFIEYIITADLQYMCTFVCIWLIGYDGANVRHIV